MSGTKKKKEAKPLDRRRSWERAQNEAGKCKYCRRKRHTDKATGKVYVYCLPHLKRNRELTNQAMERYRAKQRREARARTLSAKRAAQARWAREEA
jgi:hypothetical protein